MKQLLVVHHTASPRVDDLVEAVLEGARDPQIHGVEVVARAALDAGSAEVLRADGYILVTPANLGYMSGALKHFFDVIYYPCLRETLGRPYGLVVTGNNDVDGALAAIRRIVKGLDWREAHEPLLCVGELSSKTREQAWELGATVAATLTFD